MWKYLNKGVSTPIAIIIIAVFFLSLANSQMFYQSAVENDFI